MSPFITKEIEHLKEIKCNMNDDWYIVKQLGKGHFGKVYLGIHSKYGIKAALKFIKIKTEEKNDEILAGVSCSHSQALQR